MSRRRKVAVGVVGTLVTLNGVYGAWAWLENTRLVNQITRETAVVPMKALGLLSWLRLEWLLPGFGPDGIREGVHAGFAFWYQYTSSTVCLYSVAGT